ncbi:MAG: YigZ family protein [Bacteroidetes bacterium]|nr:MAG: YigZ family protein [Bacteroidota bacterium]
MDDIFKTIETESRGFFKEKGSKFYSFAFPVQSENEIKDKLQVLRKEHHSARHHCFAWRMGSENITFRANDDGEPSSTAGKPILGQIQSFNVTNILIVVVRYFGGTLLGTGGLINAYRNAAADALNNAKIVEKLIERKIKLSFGYNLLSEVMNIIKQEKLTVTETRFEEDCEVLFSVRKSDFEKMLTVFGNLYGVSAKY